MEILFNKFSLDIPPDCFPLSTDSMVLAHFAKLPKNAAVLDLGSGCGTLGLLLCATDENCRVTGLERSPAAHEAALANIERNALSARLQSICGDLRDIPNLIPASSFSSCISNPPYFSSGPQSRAHGDARRQDHCSTGDLFAAAAWAVKYGGDFTLVHRPETLAELCAEAAAHGFAPKRLGLLRHREGGKIALILLSCRKGGKQGLTFEEISLFDRDGNPTPIYREIYHC